MNLIAKWLFRHLSDPQVILLSVFLIVGFGIVLGLGDLLMPLLASLVIAYLLEGLVAQIQRWYLPRWFAVILVYLIFLAALLSILLILVPILVQQITKLLQEAPNMLLAGKEQLVQLRVHYPDFLSEEQLSTLVNTLRAELTLMAQQVLSLSSVLSLFTMLIYLVLMPLLVFFFLQDKILIINWIKQFLPEDIQLVKRVWQEVNLQIGNYVRGKVIEIILVWAATGITLAFMGMNYAMLLGFLVGLSVIIPYIGSLVVTVPVVIVGYFQWGLDTHFMYVMALYTIIQVLDGNVLVPLLFSEVVNLHPVAIILAVLIFGGLWGFWGVFFAIPLATLVNAVINAWPGIPEESSEPKVWTG